MFRKVKKNNKRLRYPQCLCSAMMIYFERSRIINQLILYIYFMQYKVIGDENGVRNIAGEIYQDGAVITLNEAVATVALEQGFVEPVEVETEVKDESEKEESSTEVEVQKNPWDDSEYLITNKETGETKEVALHTSGGTGTDEDPFTSTFVVRDGLTIEQWTTNPFEGETFVFVHSDAQTMIPDNGEWTIEKKVV